MESQRQERKKYLFKMIFKEKKFAQSTRVLKRVQLHIRRK